MNCTNGLHPTKPRFPSNRPASRPSQKPRRGTTITFPKKLRRPIEPQTRYAQLGTVVLGSKLHSLSRQNPLEHFDSNPSRHADLQEAGPYLDLYITRHSPESDDTLARTRERYVRDRPGSRALAWSLSLEPSERKFLWGDVNFTFPVTHCLVAEGAIESIWDWLVLDGDMGPKDPVGEGNLRWKQNTMRSMVEAQVFWGQTKDCWSDAINTVIRSQQNMSFKFGRPASLFVHKTMLAAHTPVRNPLLYDQLAELVRRLHQGHRNFNMAISDLRHPFRPNTARFIKLLETDLKDDQQLQRWFSPETYHAGLSLYFTLLNLAQTCLAERRRSTAEWVLDIGYDRAPHLFSGKLQNDRFKSKINTRVPAPLTRKASEAEIMAGAKVDAEGNIISDPAVQTHWEQTYRMRPVPEAFAPA